MPAFLATCGILKLETAYLMVPICAPFWSSTFHIPWKPQNFKADSINDKYHRGPLAPNTLFRWPDVLVDMPQLAAGPATQTHISVYYIVVRKTKVATNMFATNSTLGARIAIPLLQSESPWHRLVIQAEHPLDTTNNAHI